MKRVEKQRKPLVFRLGTEGGAPSLQVVREEFAQLQPVEKVRVQEEGASVESFPIEEADRNYQMQNETVADGKHQSPSPVDNIYVNREGNVTGPFTEKELRRHWANGVIYSDDHVWKEGMADWVVLGSYFGVPVLSANSASVSSLSNRRAQLAEVKNSEGVYQAWLVMPALFSIISMLSALFFVIVMPENTLYFAVACGLTLVLALVVCFVGRKLSLVLLMALNVLVPALAWYYNVGNSETSPPPDDTVEQKGENFPASITPKVASKKV